ncbi:TIGR00341 family protein [Chitinophaga japonensis]|uniref:Putative hydrophobic protein (TIGR00341 family) n=1 Tax=Chitinophaga japonensis TaxID=104662 RepID=A0A562TC10_CHIJA|nr:TIGR00341 family protein [Chitinophaga japonensis]TWI91035.1 putative hydrophobic protein (TIGR00341 family) [Chitinophaga japonensis]
MTKRFLVLLRHIFSLEEDKAKEEEIAENIQRGVEFRGTNLWVLIFAIIIASIGLNMNSTAVVIGAMLISPIMGPIMGVGFGVATIDFELIKRSLRNLATAVIISLMTSTAYFLVSPLSDAQSELLARTTPTIWDVLIALFGGLAGIVGATRKEKGNVIPGMAIATALMPPLCTAGYGLANGQWYFFFGAFYLFFINSVFISFATFIIVRFLKFRTKVWEDDTRARRVRRYVWAITIATAIPSIYLGYRIVQKSIFTTNALKFVHQELDFPDTQIVTERVDGANRTIDVLLIGNPVDSPMIAQVKARLASYNLLPATLTIRQGLKESGDLGQSSFKMSILEDVYQKNIQVLEEKDKQIARLQQEVNRAREQSFPLEDIAREAKAEHTNIEEFGLARMVIANLQNKKNDTIIIANIKVRKAMGREEQTRLKNWIKARTASDEVKLVIER